MAEADARADELPEAIERFNLGLLLEEHGDRDAAELAYRQADDWGHAGATINLAVLLEERGEVGDAEICYRRALDRGDRDGAFNLGALLEGQGDLAGAEEAYEIAATGGHAEAAVSLGELHRRGDAVDAAPAQAPGTDRSDLGRRRRRPSPRRAALVSAVPATALAAAVAVSMLPSNTSRRPVHATAPSHAGVPPPVGAAATHQTQPTAAVNATANHAARVVPRRSHKPKHKPTVVATPAPTTVAARPAPTTAPTYYVAPSGISGTSSGVVSAGTSGGDSGPSTYSPPVVPTAPSSPPVSSPPPASSPPPSAPSGSGGTSGSGSSGSSGGSASSGGSGSSGSGTVSGGG